MYEIDPVPNSDQTYCDNCETIVDEKMITETITGEPGCVNCIDRCLWCGNYYLREDMYDNPYLGFCCDACLHAEDYMKASKDEVLKQALRCLFDSTTSKEVENLIITIGVHLEYFELVNELCNDKS